MVFTVCSKKHSVPCAYLTVNAEKKNTVLKNYITILFKSSKWRIWPYALDKDMADDILYVLLDGSSVNTRVQDEGGSTCRTASPYPSIP